MISTFASAPYVHLQLEFIRRILPALPVLVHDDHSGDPLLPVLCRRYGVFFQRNSVPFGFPAGDLTSFVHGLRWAASQQLDILVKFSRRFIPTHDWVMPLQHLARANQCPTFSSICRNLNWGFRSEAVGMHVPSWVGAGMIETIELECHAPYVVFVEHFIHQCARTVLEAAIDQDVRSWRCSTPYPEYDGSFVMWSSLGQNRVVKVPGLLWHHSCSTSDYYAESKRMGLSYTLPDFDRPCDRLGH